MPAEMERALKRSAKKKGFVGERFNRYVYGTMMKHTSWRPKRHKGKK